jgi:hypothetical protein
MLLNVQINTLLKKIKQKIIIFYTFFTSYTVIHVKPPKRRRFGTTTR